MWKKKRLDSSIRNQIIGTPSCTEAFYKPRAIDKCVIDDGLDIR